MLKIGVLSKLAMLYKSVCESIRELVILSWKTVSASSWVSISPDTD